MRLRSDAADDDVLDTRLRVLSLIKGLGPGGAEHLVLAMAPHIAETAAVTVAYVVPEKDALVAPLRAAGVEVIRLGEGGWSWLPALRRELGSGRYDIVHAHSPLLAAAARTLVRIRRRRPAMVTTEHNAWSTFALPTRLANGITAPLDDVTLAVSQQARSSVWWPRTRARTEVLVHGIDLEQVRSARPTRQRVRAELGAADDEIVVATVANYRRQKAYPTLLRAARDVLDCCPSARFVAVGQGPLAAEIEAEHARLGLGERFRLLGRRDDVPSVLAAADVFTLASDYEGLPVALMEAVALGLPIVATAVGGVAEFVTDGSEGLLVPAGNPEALARALERVVSDADLRHRLASAAERRGDDFDIARVARTVLSRYETVSARRRR